MGNAHLGWTTQASTPYSFLVTVTTESALRACSTDEARRMRLWSTVAILLALCRGDIPTDPCAEVRATGEPAPSSGLVLVTGGSGFIGSHLVELLLGLGYAVRVLDNFSTGDAGYLPLRGRANLEVVYGDIRDKAALREAVKGVVGDIRTVGSMREKCAAGPCPFCRGWRQQITPNSSTRRQYSLTIQHGCAKSECTPLRHQ